MDDSQHGPPLFSSGVIERRLRADDLTSGSLTFGPKEAADLDLPAHHEELEVHVGDRHLYLHWNPRDRRLTGEGLEEYLSDEGQEGQILRLHRSGDRFELELVPISESTTRRVLTDVDRPRRPTTRQPRSGPRRVSNARKDRYRIRAHDEFTWDGAIGISRSSIDNAREALLTGGWDSLAGYQLRLRGEHLAAVSGFEELLSADTANVEQMPHQYAAALKVLSAMNGRAILADEVGLGKTIEAGLIASELVLRGLAERTLVICPAGLRDQWHEELKSKFGIDTRIVLRGTDDLDADNLIISHQLARRKRDELAAQSFDLVVVDEAHKMRGRVSQELLQQVSDGRYLLYLTATPVQNSLDELYQLVESLRPGTFRSKAEFRSRFCGDDGRTPSDPEGLRQLVRDVMVRTTRAQAGLDNVQRFVTEVPVVLSASERQQYEQLLSVLRAHFTEPGDHFRRQAYAQRLAASPRSLAVSLLKHIGEDDPGPAAEHLRTIADDAMIAVQTTRQREFVDQVRKWVDDPAKGKVLVFTQHTEVAEDLLRQLAAEDIDAVPYHGGISATKRRETIAAFRNDVPVMISTDAGAEGLNLQFCNCVINFDLPWNPMRIEQRIGRVHRITQKRDVYVANMYAVGTVEDRVYELLREKLRMFELLFGQITLILGEISEEQQGSIESQIAAAVFEQSERRADGKFEEIGEALKEARASADEEIAAASDLSYLSSWDTSHRDGLSAEGADDLRPDAVVRQRLRQDEVVSFVHDFLEFIGADVERTSAAIVGNDGLDRQVFISAGLPEELRPTFDGVDRLNIAFHPSGLSQHRDAELCAVGSDLFEELVQHLRTSGDLLIQIPDVQLDESAPLVPAADDLTYLGRTIVGAAGWRASGTWRLGIDGPSQSERVLTLLDEAMPVAPLLRELEEHEQLPATVNVEQLVATISRDASDAVRDLLHDADRTFAEVHRREQERLSQHYDAQIDDLSWRVRGRFGSDKTQLQQKISGLEQARDRLISADPPSSTGRLDLLALQLVAGPELEVEERWATPGGQELVAEVLLDTRAGTSRVQEGPHGLVIETVAACRAPHLADLNSLATCAECLESFCPSCDQRQAPQTCPMCDRSACTSCRTDGLCTSCHEMTRAEGDDRDGLLAFRVGGGKALLVGPSSALLDGAPIAGAHHTFEAARDVAVSHGVGADSPIVFDALEFPTPSAAVCIPLDSEITTAVAARPGRVPRSSHDAAALTALGIQQHDMPPLHPAAPQPVLTAVARAREQVAPDGDELVVKEVGFGTFLNLGPTEPVIVTYSRGVDGDTVTSGQPIEWSGTTDVRTARVSGHGPEVELELRRLHASYLLTVMFGDDPASTYFIPGTERSTFADETRLAHASERYDSNRPVLYRGPTEPCPDSVTNPSASLVSRTVEPIDLPAPLDSPRLMRADELQEQVDVESTDDAPMSLPMLGPWVRRLSLQEGPPRVTLERRYRVTELWRRDADLEFSYEVAGGVAPTSPLGSATDFLVDRGAHAVVPNDAIGCEICGLHSCADCSSEVQVADCPRCSEPSCGVCRTTNGPPSLTPDDRCSCCSRLLCSACGRLEFAGQCSLCDGLTCHLCLDDTLCACCRDLRVADGAEIAALPEALAAQGHLVLLAGTAERRVVVLAGGMRRERIILNSEGQVSTWHRAHVPTDELSDLVRSAATHGPVKGFELTERAAPEAEGGLTSLASHTTYQIAAVGRSGLVAGPLPCDAPTSSLDLAASLLHRDSEVRSIYLEDFRPALEAAVAGHAVPAGDLVRIESAAIRHELLISEEGVRHRVVASDEVSDDSVGFSEVSGRLSFNLSHGLPWTLHADRVGNALRLTLRRALDGKVVTTLAVADSSAPDWTYHLRLDRLREHLGLPPETRLVAGQLGAAAEPGRNDGSSPVRREVLSELHVAAAPSPFDAEIPADVLGEHGPMAPTEYSSTTVFVVEPRVLARAFGNDARVSASVSLWHDCVDTWQDAGVREVRYRVEGSSPVPAPEPDTAGSPSWDFRIDRSGHIVAPGEGATCELCHGELCSACSPEVRIDACNDCEQPSCGECRTGSTSDVLAQPAAQMASCHLCGGLLCPSCRRLNLAGVCEVCKQPMCHSCRSGARCVGCTSFRPASRDEIDRLPAELHISGLSVSASSDERSSVFLVSRGIRREIVVMDGTTPRSWRSVGAVGPNDWRLAWLCHDAVSSVLLESGPRAKASPHPELVLLDKSERRVRLTGPSGTELVAAPAVDGVDPRLTIAQLHSEDPAPAFEQGRDSTLDGLFEGGERGAPITLSSFTRLDTVTVGAEGLLITSGSPSDPTTLTVPWTAAPERQADGLPIDFDQVMHAAHQDVSADLIDFGPTRFLLLRGDDAELTWLRVDHSETDPRLVALGQRLLGRAVPTVVSLGTLPGEPRFLHLLNAELEERVVAPLATPSDLDVDPTRTAEAAATLVDLPTAMIDADQAPFELLDEAPASDDVVVVAVGLQVVERWKHGDEIVELDYEIAPGELRAQQPAYDTLAPTREFTIDQESHLVAHPTSCQTCGAVACVRCVDAVSACTICASPRCNHCGPTRGEHVVCEACAAAEPLKGLRRLGASLRGTVHVGRSRDREVRVTIDKDSVIVAVSESGQPQSEQTFTGERARTIRAILS